MSADFLANPGLLPSSILSSLLPFPDHQLELSSKAAEGVDLVALKHILRLGASSPSPSRSAEALALEALQSCTIAEMTKERKGTQELSLTWGRLSAVKFAALKSLELISSLQVGY